MPILFVHGVPETAALWNDLRAELRRADTLALALPGFGCPRPAGRSATKEAYVDWLVRELERIGPAIDLVSHDWGGAFALRAVSLHPELVRSWVSDAAGMADVEFEWHAFAKSGRPRAPASSGSATSSPSRSTSAPRRSSGSACRAAAHATWRPEWTRRWASAS
jgi:pimeloyl-ACP methyl ester carboxylesterase